MVLQCLIIQTQLQRCCWGFAMRQPICALTVINNNILFWSTREAAAFVAKKPVNCHLLAMFELLWAKQPVHDIWLLLASRVQAPLSWLAFAGCTPWPCGRVPSRRYRFSICLTANVNFFLPATWRFAPPHIDIDFLFTSRQMSFFLLPTRWFVPLMEISIFYLPHGESQFFLPPPQQFAPLTARYQFSLCLTAIINFISPIRQFASQGNINFLFASQR